MNSVTGVIISTKQNGYKILDRCAMKNFSLDLGKGRSWKLGIDPASRYTGIALLESTGNFVVLLDCARDMRLPPDQFYDDLFYLLKRLVSKQDVVRVVTEEPFVNSKFRRASVVLLTLRGKIEDWVHSITELSVSEFAKVNTNVWKSRVIDKSKGKNRFNADGAVADDLCDIFPQLRPYRNLNVVGDLDSFDALGVIIGHEMYAYTETGEKKISGAREKKHRSLVGFKWVDSDSIDVDFVYNTLGLLGKAIKPECLVYNEDYSFAENVMMATTSHDAITCIIPENQLQQFQWKFGIDITDKNKVLIMFAFRKGHFTVKECQYLQERFEWKEEMGGE